MSNGQREEQDILSHDRLWVKFLSNPIVNFINFGCLLEK